MVHVSPWITLILTCRSMWFSYNTLTTPDKRTAEGLASHWSNDAHKPWEKSEKERQVDMKSMWYIMVCMQNYEKCSLFQASVGDLDKGILGTQTMFLTGSEKELQKGCRLGLFVSEKYLHLKKTQVLWQPLARSGRDAGCSRYLASLSEHQQLWYLKWVPTPLHAYKETCCKHILHACSVCSALDSTFRIMFLTKKENHFKMTFLQEAPLCWNFTIKHVVTVTESDIWRKS